MTEIQTWWGRGRGADAPVVPSARRREWRREMGKIKGHPTLDNEPNFHESKRTLREKCRD